MAHRRLLLTLAMIAALGSPAAAEDLSRPPPGRVSMAGDGEAFGSPDMATFSAGVVSIAPTAQVALDQNTNTISSVLAALRGAGIEARDLASSGFSVQSRFVYPQSKPGQPAEPPKLDGYEVRNSVTVKVRDLGRLGAILDLAVQNGANQVGGIGFDIQDKDALLDQARQDAIADAQRKAEKAARAAGLKLGRVLALSETVQQFPPRPMGSDAMSFRAAGAPVPVEPGERKIGAHVEMTWQIAE
ncbi:SIMPL domain-containing protein [Microvirga sp. 3-52]|nr:SIMPL domain-containing protein [Microvirga sp. 3-52]